MYVRFMQAGAVLERLAEIPPGAALAVALDALDLASIPNDQIVDVLGARYRQLAHDQAELLATLVEVGRRVPDAGPGCTRRADQVLPWASGEVAAALTLTHRSADRELHFAETVLGLPLVFAALRAGRIDRGKAWVFADHLHPLACGLTDAQIEAVCARLVPPAAGWTTGQLAARLLRAIIAVDPEHARRRYEKAVRERQVCGYLDHTGTVTITATGLATDEAAAACERLERLAAVVKRAGHTGRVANIQADLFLGLLDGRFHHKTEAQIVAAFVAGGGEEASDSGACAAPTVSRPASSEPGVAPIPDAAPDPYVAGEPDFARDPDAAREPVVAPASETVTEPAAESRTGVEIRVGLSTLLGLDEQPGEIPGLGPVLAPVARKIVAAQMRGAQWRFAVTDTEGYLGLAGIIRRRPTRQHHAEGGASDGGIVEIHLPPSLLRQFAAAAPAHGEWAGVINDIATQYSRRDVLEAALERHPGTRFVRGPLARHIEVRDRTCSHPGCRRPARKSELDHTRDHALGGSTTSANAGPGCRMHHFWKSELGWRLRQPRPGRFEWTSPLGRTYRTRGEPIGPPMPGPQVREPTSVRMVASVPVPKYAGGLHPRDSVILRLPPTDSAPQAPPGADEQGTPPF